MTRESDFAVNKYVHTVASCWILLIYIYIYIFTYNNMTWESDFAVNKYLHTVASCWNLLIYIFIYNNMTLDIVDRSKRGFKAYTCNLRLSQYFYNDCGALIYNIVLVDSIVWTFLRILLIPSSGRDKNTAIFIQYPRQG